MPIPYRRRRTACRKLLLIDGQQPGKGEDAVELLGRHGGFTCVYDDRDGGGDVHVEADLPLKELPDALNLDAVRKVLDGVQRQPGAVGGVSRVCQRLGLGKYDGTVLFESMLVCVFLHKNHPLADRAQISFAGLKPYPCFVLGQGEDSSFYYAEEVLTTAEYDRVIHVSDSPSMRRMLSAMDGYVLCSGLCEDKKQSEFLTIPYLADETNPGGVTEIGYITKNGMVLGELSRAFLSLAREELHLLPEDIDAQV